MRNKICIVITISLVASLLACKKEPESIKPGNFEPYKDHDQITTINRRTAQPAECIQSKAENIEWPFFPSWTPDEFRRFFAEKVVIRGSSNEGWAILELDRRTIESALQIALAEKRIDPSEVQTLREKAQRQLYKPSSRTFVLMHNYQDLWALGDSEPTLISQRSGSARLVGMSVALGLGMKRGEIGLLEFEDKVCEDDASYAVHLELTHSKSIRDLEPGIVFGGSRDSCHFVFGGEHNPLPVFASVFQSYVPSRTSMSSEKSLNIHGMYVSLQDMMVIGQFALALISFLLKLA